MCAIAWKKRKKKKAISPRVLHMYSRKFKCENYLQGWFQTPYTEIDGEFPPVHPFWPPPIVPLFEYEPANISPIYRLTTVNAHMLVFRIIFTMTVLYAQTLLLLFFFFLYSKLNFLNYYPLLLSSLFYPPRRAEINCLHYCITYLYFRQYKCKTGRVCASINIITM